MRRGISSLIEEREVYAQRYLFPPLRCIPGYMPPSSKVYTGLYASLYASLVYRGVYLPLCLPGVYRRVPPL